MRLLKRTPEPPGRGARRAPQRRQAPPRWLRTAVIGGTGAVAIAAVAGAGLYGWHSGWLAESAAYLRAGTLAITAEAGLTVQEVLLEGRAYTAREDVAAALALRRGQPILAFSPEAARRRLAELPWVRAATVERRLPATVVVRIVERRPLALWQQGDALVLIDDRGEVVTAEALERFRGLLVVAGDDAPAHARALTEMLASEPALRAEVAGAIRVGARRWNLRLKGGVDVQLPEDGAPAAWARLARLHREHQILSRDIDVIDLRLPDRMVVRTRASRLTASGDRSS